MTRLEKLPTELLQTILSAVADLDKDRIAPNLFNVALTSKALSPIAVSLLYRWITVSPNQNLLLPLLYRLLRNEHLANSVQSLTCLCEVEDEGDYPISWPYPADFARLRFLRLGQGPGVEPPFDKDPMSDELFHAIARLCPNLVEMRVSTVFGDGFEDGEMFEADQWPWKRLETVETHHVMNKGFPEDEGRLLGELLNSISTSVAPVKHLRCVNIGLNQLKIIEELNDSSLNIDTLRLYKVRDEANNEWSTAETLLRACRGLEEFHLGFQTLKHVNVYNNLVVLLGYLRSHSSSLRSLHFGWEDADSTPGLVLGAPVADDGIDLLDFECLEEVSVPVPFLFGFAFFFDPPNLYETSSNLPNHAGGVEFGKQFKDKLCEFLPTTIREIRIPVYNVLQTNALIGALSGLLEQRASLFPRLSYIGVSVHLSERISLRNFDRLLNSEVCRDAQAEGIRIEVFDSDHPTSRGRIH